MKKLIVSACVLGSALALTACDSAPTGYVDTQPPFAHERTVGTVPTVAAPAAEAPVTSAAPVFEKKVTK